MQSRIEEQNKRYAQHLCAMIRCKTISFSDASKMEFAEFEKLHALLVQMYPLANTALEKTRINKYGLLYRWKGNGKSGLEPILFTAHQDVVPADGSLWKHDPFAGEIADGFVWGRGSMDGKCLILGHMEAIEALLAQGFAPDRDVYLAYGFDQEVMGLCGAQEIANYLHAQGLHFDLVLDEGGTFVRGEPFDVHQKILAQIGIFEKGCVDIQLSVNDEGGHASRPKEQTALGVLCDAIDAVERHPFETFLSAALVKMYEALYGHVAQGLLRGGIERAEQDPESLIRLLEASPAGNAMIRTTAAATMAWASVAPNVLPQRAQAVFNVRMVETGSVAQVVEHFAQAIADERVDVAALSGFEPSRTSDIACEAYAMLKKTIADLNPEVLVIPVPVSARTDASMYECVAEHIYRFSPFIGHMDLLNCVHGSDERTPVDRLHDGVQFYIDLLRRMATEQGRSSV